MFRLLILVTPTGGTSYTQMYYVLVKYNDGTVKRICATNADGITTSGPYTLDAIHYNTLSWPAVPAAVEYQVYRSFSTGSQSNNTGYLATLSPGTDPVIYVDNGTAASWTITNSGWGFYIGSTNHGTYDVSYTEGNGPCHRINAAGSTGWSHGVYLCASESWSNWHIGNNTDGTTDVSTKQDTLLKGNTLQSYILNVIFGITAPKIHVTNVQPKFDPGAYGFLSLQKKKLADQKPSVVAYVGGVGSSSANWGLKMYDSLSYKDTVTFTDGDTMPSILGANMFQANNSSPTTITMLDDPVKRQIVVIKALNGNTTIQHNAVYIRLKGGTNKALAALETIMLGCFDGSSWDQL